MDFVPVDVLQGVMDAALQPMILLSPLGTVLLVNSPLLAMLGYKTNDIVGRQFATLHRSVADATASVDSGTTMMRSDGAEVVVDIAALRLSGGLVLKTLTPKGQFLADADATKAHEKVRSDFLARIGHELRTPLNAVLGTVSTLLEQPSLSFASEEQSRFSLSEGLETIRSSSESLLSLIVDLLDFSATDAAHAPAVQFVDFILMEVVTESIRIAATTMHLPYPSIVLFVDPRLPLRVRTDPVVLSHALVKVVTCLLRYCDLPSLVVRIEETSEPLAEGVSDSAVPVPDCPMITVEFHLQDAELFSEWVTPAPAIAGPGPRMSIGGTSQRDADIGRVRVIGQQSFRRLGGYLKHSAASSDKPSEILLYLPMGVPPATPPLTWSELAKPACGTHVVLLDIDPVKRKAVVDQLEAWGFRVSCVLDAHGLKTLVDEAVPRSFITLHVLEPLSSDTVADVKQTLDDTSSAAKSAKGIVWTVPDFIDVDSTGHPKGEIEHTIRNVTNPADLLGIILEIMQPTAEQRALDPAVVLNASVQADLCLGHVLIVDDNPINLRVEKSMVEKRGYRVDVAYDGKEALEILATRPYDIVLMDCEMPIMDGFTATRHFRANERAWERTPIVAVSAHALEEDRKRCLDCGMDDFMSKPVSSVTLASVFARWSTPGQRIRHLSQLEDTDQMNMLHELAVLAEADRSCTSSSQFRELLTALQHAANLLGAQRMSTRCSWVLSSLATNDVDQQRHALADLDHEARALRILADD